MSPSLTCRHDPVRTLQGSYAIPGLDVFRGQLLRSVEQWAGEHRPGARGAHDYDLADYGLTPECVRERFADYLAQL